MTATCPAPGTVVDVWCLSCGERNTVIVPTGVLESSKVTHNCCTSKPRMLLTWSETKPVHPKLRRQSQGRAA